MSNTTGTNSAASANFSLEEMDKHSVFHPVTSIDDHQKNGPVIYSRASGVRLKDGQDRDLIDLGAGLWCVNVGYGREEISEAAATAMRELSYHHLFGGASNEATIRLADRLLSLLREQSGASHMARVFSDRPDRMQTTRPSSSFDTTTTCSAGPKEEDYFADGCLPRGYVCKWQPDRHLLVPYRLRHAGCGRAARGLPALLPLR